MSALFNFQSLLTVVLLLICTCAYVRGLAPRLLDKNKEGLLGIFWKCARIGERKSPYVALCCIGMAISILFWSWWQLQLDRNNDILYCNRLLTVTVMLACIPINAADDVCLPPVCHDVFIKNITDKSQSWFRIWSFPRCKFQPCDEGPRVQNSFKSNPI